MGAHDHEVELLLLREGGDFVACVADEADFLGRDGGLGKERTQRLDGFIELVLLQFEHFLFGECGQGHAGHVGHHGAGVVAHHVDEVELCARAEERDVLEGVAHGGSAVLGAVDRDADLESVGLRRGLVAQHQDGALGLGENAVRDGAEEEAAKSGLAAGAHDDQVGAELFGFGRDAVGGFADEEGLACLEADLVELGAHGFEDLGGFVFIVAGQGVLADESAGACRKRKLNVQDFDFRIAPEKRGAAGDEFHGVHAVFTAVNGNENAHITS